MSATGNISISVASGVPTATVNGPVSGGGSIADGTYVVGVTQDNSGTTVFASTPFGVAQNSNVRNNPAIDG
jgi:hypothetical protein